MTLLYYSYSTLSLPQAERARAEEHMTAQLQEKMPKLSNNWLNYSLHRNDCTKVRLSFDKQGPNFTRRTLN